MLKYVKINPDTKVVIEKFDGTDTNWAIQQGFTTQDVEQSEINGNWYLMGYAPHYTEEEKAQKERERLNGLSLTKREVFLAIYNDKNITPEQIRAQITNTEALIEFDYANSYFRGNPLIALIGTQLGYSEAQLDYLFENGNF